MNVVQVSSQELEDDLYFGIERQSQFLIKWNLGTGAKFGLMFKKAPQRFECVFARAQHNSRQIQE